MSNYGIADAAVHIGAEGTYATAAACTQSLEAKADDHKVEEVTLETEGMRAGAQGITATRRRKVIVGATGSYEVDVKETGLLPLLAATVGTTTATAGAEDTTVYTFASNTGGPTGSVTTRIERPTATGDLYTYEYRGGVALNYELSQEKDANLQLKVSMDYAGETILPVNTTTTPNYSDSFAFNWTGCEVLVGGVPVDNFESFSLKYDHALGTDDRSLKRSAGKRRPRRKGIPKQDGQLKGFWDSNAMYQRYLASDAFEVVVRWYGIDATLTLTLASIQLDGGTPNVSLSEIAKQELPFTVLDPGDGRPAVSLQLITTETHPGLPTV